MAPPIKLPFSGEKLRAARERRTFVAALNCDPSELLDEPAAGAA
jgi:hypothetical protein